MIAPVASLFVTPLDAGAQGVAAAVKPATDSGDSFGSLVSALVDAADGPQTAAPSTLPPQLPQASDAEAPTNDFVQSAFPLSTAEASFEQGSLSSPTSEQEGESDADKSQSASSAPPTPSLETARVAKRTQPLLKNTGPLAQAGFADESPANPLALLQDTPTTFAAAEKPIPQNEEPDPSSASNGQILSDPLPQTAHVSEAETKASGSNVASDPETAAANLAKSVAAPGSSANSSTTAQRETTDTDEQGEQPLIDILAQFEIASPVVAQFLAAQPQRDVQQDQVKLEQATRRESEDASGALLQAENSSTPIDSAALPLPPVTQTSDSASPPDNATAPNTNAAAAAAELISPDGGPGPSRVTAAQSAPSNFAETLKTENPATETSGPIVLGADAATGEPGTTFASARDENGSVTTAPAIRPAVSKAASASLSAANTAETDSADDRTNKPSDTPQTAVSNPAVEAAVSKVVARPAAIARDAVDSGAPVEAVSSDLSGGTPRVTRAPVRGSFALNRDSAGAQSQSPTSSGPDLTSALEKSEPLRSAEGAQDRGVSKTISQPATTNLADSAPEADAPKPHQTVDLAQAAEPPQLPVDKTDTLAAPAPQSQPAPIDIVLPAGAGTRGFEMPLAHATTPSGQDVPVRLAFNAPNVPDNSAFDALALKIASHSSDGDSRFSIRLDPPELGKIEVNLSVDAHGHAQAELSADKPQTLELLQKDASVLERALKDAGLNLSGGLAFSLKGDGRSQAWRDTQNGRSRGLQIAAADAASASAAITARAALAGQAYGLPISNLDIRV